MNTFLKRVYDLFPFKRQAFLILKQFYHPRQTLYQRLNFDGPFRVRFDGRSFLFQNYASYDHVIENEIFWNGLTGGWEKTSLALWIKLCESSRTIFDIGANTGIYSLVAKTANPHATVFAFEPIPRIVRKLRTNIRLNNFDIRVCTDAVSNRDGVQTMYDSSGGHTYTASLTPEFDQNSVEVEVKTTRLSTFIRQQGLSSVDVMKLDVETHEYEVLAGMEEYFDLMKPTLLIEILSPELGSKIERFVEGKGYLYFAVHEDKAPSRVQSLGSRSARNVLMCSAERALMLGLLM
jgi:FkbM family methyltransferase